MSAEDSLDLSLAHPVEVIRYSNQPCHETEPPCSSTGWSTKRCHLYEWFTSLGNNERFPIYGLAYEFCELSFRLPKVHCFHSFHRLLSNNFAGFSDCRRCCGEKLASADREGSDF